PTAAATLVVPHQDEVRTQIVDCGKRSAVALRRLIDVRRHQLDTYLRSYGLRRPRLLLQEHAQTLDARLERGGRAVEAVLRNAGARLEAAAGRLQALSPRGILERGYTYCVDVRSGQLVGRAAETRPGQALRLHF